MAAKTAIADVIVIGGGMAGLAAARELARARLRVVLLEARHRLGGRIDTRRLAHGTEPMELGAQFIHVGNRDLWQLLKRAGIQTRRLGDRHWFAGPEGIRKISRLDQRLACVTRQIRPRAAGNASFAAYFRRHPPQISREAWLLAKGFVEGFEAAPLDEISARSLAAETMDEQLQFTVPGGYDQVIAALAADCWRLGVQIRMGAVVRNIRWRRGSVIARHGTSRAGKTLQAKAAVVTLPLGVLQRKGGAGAVRFEPSLKQTRRVIDQMRMGHVVRVVVRFRAGIWRRMAKKIPNRLRRGGFGFLHSGVRGMPVWWSLSDEPVLVGWAGGPAAVALLKLSPAARRQRALRSLAESLRIAPATLRQGMVEWQEHDWTHDPFTRGAYTFTAAGADQAAELLRKPVQRTLFFAGEALADGAEVGTVHGALASGIRAAKAIIRNTRR